MIELKDAQEQLSRMIGLNFGPRAAQQRQEVLRVMCQARTVLILADAVTSWLASSPNFPKPAEIVPIITSLNVSHAEALEMEQRRREIHDSRRQAASPPKEASAREMADLRALFVDRLGTVDQRHADTAGGAKERERIKTQIRAMIALIDSGTDFKGLIGIRANQNIPPDGDLYYGDF